MDFNTGDVEVFHWRSHATVDHMPQIEPLALALHCERVWPLCCESVAEMGTPSGCGKTVRLKAHTHGWFGGTLLKQLALHLLLLCKCIK